MLTPGHSSFHFPMHGGREVALARVTELGNGEPSNMTDESARNSPSKKRSHFSAVLELTKLQRWGQISAVRVRKEVSLNIGSSQCPLGAPFTGQSVHIVRLTTSAAQGRRKHVAAVHRLKAGQAPAAQGLQREPQTTHVQKRRAAGSPVKTELSCI